MSPHLHLLALSMVKGLGPVHIRNLIAYCGSAEAVFTTSMGKLSKIPGIGEKMLSLISSAQSSLQKAESEIINCEKLGIEILPFSHKSYPQSLKFIHDAPSVLYKKGKADLNAMPMIAIVGTRKPTAYGKEMTTFFAEYLAERGINVISGLAYGVDILAHKAALKQSGVTTAVLAHGLDRIYPPTHTEKAIEIQEKGAILSEFPLGTKPDAVNFPARNRIVSGMSKAILVIEAAASGGALITARSGFDQNREIYALPGNVGNPYSAGCNQLIRENIAKLITHPQEVLDDLQIAWQTTTPQALELDLGHENLSIDEARIVDTLKEGEQLIDTLAVKTHIPISRLNALLLTMEFGGWITQLPGKKFRLAKQ